MVNSTFHSIPLHARDGKSGSPKGEDGTDGHSKTTGCGQLITTVEGSDIAGGATTWTPVDGMTVDKSSLTQTTEYQ